MSSNPLTTAEQPVQAQAGSWQKRRVRNKASVAARGEPMLWLTGGCVAVAVAMIVTLLGFIAYQGIVTFWPKPLVEVTLSSGRVVMGEPTRQNNFVAFDAKGKPRDASRVLYKTGNYDLTGEDFTWVTQDQVASTRLPEWGLVIERVAWQNAYGSLEGIVIDGQEIRDPAQAWAKFNELKPSIHDLIERIHTIERDQIGKISKVQDQARLALRSMAMTTGGTESPEYRSFAEQIKADDLQRGEEINALRQKSAALWAQANKAKLLIRTAEGKIVPADRSKPDEPMYAWQVIRAYPANQLTFTGKLSVYFSRWYEYLTGEPREANMEGGVFPAIVGTVLLTMIMVVFVVPIGVIAAIYLREYAKQGLLVSIVRISVNNLAGVPSIVFGVFGLGFFCYLIGGSIDKGFFPERLPDPTIGKSALLWASLTLSLLTLPVVIVSTEEALSAVPRSMREGSYGCGASKWQTIWRIVLPRAMPGVMTGMILAIARGAGEVAPLMLVGAVKLAPDLPLSTQAPFFGIDRSFMHLGFHIYDLGFQSRNSEAAKSMVYTTTLLLITIVVVLNLTAMLIRTRLRRAYSAGQF
jgi:phosphate transport system permease protein